MTRPAVLITGVGRHSSIGAGIARRLAADGWDLAFSHFTPHDLRHGGGDADAEEIAAALRALGARAVHREIDLAEPAAAAELVAWAADELGPLTALVLTHAESVDSDIFTTTVESWDRHYAVNARASWQLIRAFAEQVPGSADGPGGRIVGLTSDHVAGNLPYGSSKGALDRILLGAAGELAPRGITANIVNPGPIDTGWMDDAIRAAGLAQQPTGRLGTPADTAALVSWLVSPDAGWVTGQLVKSDGGFSL